MTNRTFGFNPRSGGEFHRTLQEQILKSWNESVSIPDLVGSFIEPLASVYTGKQSTNYVSIPDLVGSFIEPWRLTARENAKHGVSIPDLVGSFIEQEKFIV